MNSEHSLICFQNEVVNFGASVIFELRRTKSGKYYVQMFYRNSDTECPSPINIPNCSTRCPLHKMYDLLEHVLPAENETFESFCRL